jgi:hypothetical protein
VLDRHRCFAAEASVTTTAFLCAGGFAFGNPVFGTQALSPSPDGAEFNRAFSPALPSGVPGSAVGFRRLGNMPPSQLARLGPSQVSPSGSDEAMGEGFEDNQQPPMSSLANASPQGATAAAAGASRERPEEEEFAAVLGAGGLQSFCLDGGCTELEEKEWW